METGVSRVSYNKVPLDDLVEGISNEDVEKFSTILDQFIGNQLRKIGSNQA